MALIRKTIQYKNLDQLTIDSADEIPESEMCVSPSSEGLSQAGLLFLNGIVDDEFTQLIRTYSKLTGKKDLFLLDAHGEKGPTWKYSDGTKSRAVHSWLNKLPKSTCCAFLCVCNPDGKEIKSDKTIIVYSPENILYDSFMNYGISLPYTIRVPGVGNIGKYELDYAVRQLEKTV